MSAGTAETFGARVQFGAPVRREDLRETLSVRLRPVGSSLPDRVQNPSGLIWGNSQSEQLPLPSSSAEHLNAVRVEFPLALPTMLTIRLRFANAVSDSETARGVMFRIRVLPF